MEPQEKHSMMIATTHPSGAEEWVCPTCGRRILMQWPPNYKKVVLEEGDSNAIHSGSKGGLQLGVAQISSGEPVNDNPEDEQVDYDESRLNSWLEFLQNVDVNNQLDNAAGD